MLLTLGAFSLAAVSFITGRDRADDARLELCMANNNTRAAVRRLVDLAFAPGIARAEDGERQTIRKFLEQVKEPVADLPCNQVGQ
jgi:hypothetical protein